MRQAQRFDYIRRQGPAEPEQTNPPYHHHQKAQKASLRLGPPAPPTPLYPLPSLGGTPDASRHSPSAALLFALSPHFHATRPGPSPSAAAKMPGVLHMLGVFGRGEPSRGCSLGRSEGRLA